MGKDTLESEETLTGDMLRGESFVDTYTKRPTRADQAMMKRMPTMLSRGASTLIPRLDSDDEANAKILVVFDLDETLVYAREKTLVLRPHTSELLKGLEEVCEIAVWTAGVRPYAKHIVSELEKNVWGKDAAGVIKHLISRNKNWFDANDYTKDLTKLGRDMEKVLIIENTPDCVRMNCKNAIIVEDYEGERDTAHTLRSLKEVILELCESGEPVTKFIPACKQLEKQKIKDVGEVYYLTAGKKNAKKVVGVNRDKKQGTKRKADESEDDDETEEQENDASTEEAPKQTKSPAKKKAKK